MIIKAREDRDRLIAVLYEEARYGGTVHISVAGTDIDRLPPNPTFNHSAPVPVTVRIDPGPVFKLGSVRFDGDAAGHDPEKYDLVPGGEAGSRLILKAGEQLLVDLKAEGRPLARLTRRQVTADHRTNTIDVVLGAVGGPVAPFGTVSVKGSRTVNADFISRYSRLDKHGQYSPVQLKKANDRLRELGVFSSVTIHEADKLAPDGSLPLTIEVSEGKHRYFGFGAEYSSIDGAGLEGYWGHRNLFGEAESLRIEGKVSGIGATTDVTTFDYSAGIIFTKPGAFVPEATFESRLEAKSETPDVYEAQTIIYSAGISYEPERDRQAQGRRRDRLYRRRRRLRQQPVPHSQPAGQLRARRTRQQARSDQGILRNALRQAELRTDGRHDLLVVRGLHLGLSRPWTGRQGRAGGTACSGNAGGRERP